MQPPACPQQQRAPVIGPATSPDRDRWLESRISLKGVAMKRSLQFVLVASLFCGIAGVSGSSLCRAMPQEKLWQQFAASIEADSSVAEPARAAALASLKEKEDDGISAALTALYPGYGEAVQAADQSDASTAVTRLAPFASETSNPWLAADATWYQARSLMNEERFEEAVPLLEQLTGKLASQSPHLAEAHYYVAACHAGMLQVELAIPAFSAFLEDFPEASERLRVSAWRQLQVLQESADPKMSAITSRMQYSRRRLDIEESGEQTQTEQGRIVQLLAELIQEQQKKECSNGNSSKNKAKQQKEQQQANNKQSSPQKQSQSQKGGMSNIANGEAIEKTYDNGDASPWSRLRDRSRDSANSAIKEKLPARYREIVERYNDAVSGNTPDQPPSVPAGNQGNPPDGNRR